ncbi:MAG: hypothetical protein GX682_05930 [Clostridiaceae bacterium]|nr:hypothetical protein [Clostridiaceae bacterium]
MKIRLHLKIFIFIAIFIVTRQIEIYGVLMLFAVLHELGHMITGIILGFKPNTIEIMPFGLSIGFDIKVDNYNKKIKKGTILTLKKLFIAISGPIINFIIALIFLVYPISFLRINSQIIIYANLLIGIFNLIPIYPLDGGRIIKYILHIFYGKKQSYIYSNKISYITIITLTIICSFAILYLKNIALILILVYLWYLVIKEHKIFNAKKQIYKSINKIEEKQESTVN